MLVNEGNCVAERNVGAATPLQSADTEFQNTTRHRTKSCCFDTDDFEACWTGCLKGKRTAPKKRFFQQKYFTTLVQPLHCHLQKTSCKMATTPQREVFHMHDLSSGHQATAKSAPHHNKGFSNARSIERIHQHRTTPSVFRHARSIARYWKGSSVHVQIVASSYIKYFQLEHLQM